jgi:hypothetical protein
MGPKKKGKQKAEEEVVEVSGNYYHDFDFNLAQFLIILILLEYDTMDLEMLREVVPMLRQQLEKSMLDRNYVQLERVFIYNIFDLINFNFFSISILRTLSKIFMIFLQGKLMKLN